MTPAHRVVMNTGILYARMAITVVLSLYTTRLVLDALGVDDFGIFNLVGGVIAMLTFLNASMAAATQRFMSFAQGQGDEGRQHQIFNVSVVMHAGIALIVLGLLEIAGYILFDGVLNIAPERMQTAWMVYQFAVASTFITVLGVPYDAVINARENMLLYAVLGVIEAVIKLVIAIIIFNATTDKLELYGLLMALTTVALLVMRATYCHLKYYECKYALRRYFSRPLFNQMSAFASWSLMGSTSSIVSNYGQGVVLNMHFGTTVNAAQAVTNQLSGQLGAFASTMLRALNPLIAKSAGAGDFKTMIKASMLGSKISFFLLMFFYVPVMVEMQYVLNIWLKTVPDYAVIFCKLLLLRNLVEQLFVTLVSSITSVGSIKNFQITTSLLTIITLPIAYIGFAIGWPPYMIYWIFLIYSIITSSAILFYACKLTSLSATEYVTNVLVRSLIPFMITISVSASPLLIAETGILRFSVVCTISIFSFIGTVWLIGFNQSERTLVMHASRIAMLKLLHLSTKYIKKIS